MLSLGVKNFRRLANVEPIKIKPITILVGKNTSGKSSFLRIFPLIRQSQMTRIRSPLLWYGELVDFGSFAGTIYKNETNLPLIFSFKISQLKARNPMSRYRADPVFSFKDIAVDISVVSTHDVPKIAEITFRSGESSDIFVLTFATNLLSKISLNGRDFSNRFSVFHILKEPGSLFPAFVFTRRADQEQDFPQPFDRFELMVEQTFNVVKRMSPQTVSFANLRRVAIDIQNSWPVNTESVARAFKKSTVWSLRNIGERIMDGYHQNDVKELIDTGKLGKIFIMLDEAFDYLRSVFSQSLYIAPARAAGERYYRYQDLAVSEIDPDGKNFPMFLNSLGNQSIEEFSDWIRTLFGFGVVVKRSPSHVSIEILSEGSSTNVADTGYGISQVLPVLGQIWWATKRQGRYPATRRSSVRNPSDPPIVSILAIEQPELHLHPAHQSLLGDALVSKLRVDNNQFRLHYVVETHSEALINRLGELIADGMMGPEDVQVLVFESSPDVERTTTVRIASFDREGVLQNWPFGFFLA